MDTKVTVITTNPFDIDDIASKVATRRRQFIAPVLLVYSLYYSASLLLLSYFPDEVRLHLFSGLNLAYLIAISQFISTFMVAILYYFWAKFRIDPLTNAVRG